MGQLVQAAELSTTVSLLKEFKQQLSAADFEAILPQLLAYLSAECLLTSSSAHVRDLVKLSGTERALAVLVKDPALEAKVAFTKLADFVTALGLLDLEAANILTPVVCRALKTQVFFYILFFFDKNQSDFTPPVDEGTLLFFSFFLFLL